MKVASVADMKAHFSAYLRASAEGPVVVTRNGKPVAVVLAVSDEEELERLLMAHSPRLQAILEAGRRQIQAGAGIPHDVFWREVEAESRADVSKGKRAARQTKR
jgi:prevent-host-death family protein